jgi:hypothetical protein
MNDGNYVFSQLMSLIHRQAFTRIVEKYNTPPPSKKSRIKIPVRKKVENFAIFLFQIEDNLLSVR